MHATAPARFGLAILLALLPLGVGAWWATPARGDEGGDAVGIEAGEPEPDAALAADVVVAIQLDALRRAADEPGAMATVFAFTSPENRAMTGPLERFDAMVRAEPFALLVGHRVAEVLVQGAGAQGANPAEGGPVGAEGEPTAWGAVVRVHAPDGRTGAFLWTLSRQPADAEQHPGCWMTDGVQPLADDPPAGDREDVA